MADPTPISSGTDGAAAAVGQASGSFWSQLQDASFRGVPFFVEDNGGRAGRRQAIHEYPFRDVPWSEDLGRSVRRFNVSGFVVGDDVIAQLNRMLEAVEAAGDGELVHPLLGRVQVSLVDFSWDSRKGRTIAYTFTFVRQGSRLFPGSTVDGENAVGGASATAAAKTAKSFKDKVAGAIANGAAAVNQAGMQARYWSGQVQQVANDATSLLKLAVSLPGDYGRLVGLASGVDAGQLVTTAVGMTTDSLIGAAAVQRQSVGQAIDALTLAADTLKAGTEDVFTAAAQAVADSILAVSSTPGDALRGLSRLAAFVPTGDPVGDELILQGAIADIFRRSALASLAVASSRYQPASSQDAAAIRSRVLDIMDGLITSAGDKGEDDVYAALRELRSQCVQDLNVRGAQLPTLVDITAPETQPALALAQRLYRDATRSDELVRRAGPIHPAFMPKVFQALNQ